MYSRLKVLFDTWNYSLLQFFFQIKTNYNYFHPRLSTRN